MVELKAEAKKRHSNSIWGQTMQLQRPGSLSETSALSKMVWFFAVHFLGFFFFFQNAKIILLLLFR